MHLEQYTNDYTHIALADYRVDLITVGCRYNTSDYITILDTAMAAAQHNADIDLIKDTRYLTLLGELRGVCCAS